MEKFTKILGTGLLIFCAGLLLLYVVAPAFANDTNPVALTPDAQSLYDSNAHTFCLATKNLANAKITDYANGLKELNEDDLLRLHGLRSTECPF